MGVDERDPDHTLKDKGRAGGPQTKRCVLAHTRPECLRRTMRQPLWDTGLVHEQTCVISPHISQPVLIVAYRTVGDVRPRRSGLGFPPGAGMLDAAL